MSDYDLEKQYVKGMPEDFDQNNSKNNYYPIS